MNTTTTTTKLDPVFLRLGMKPIPMDDVLSTMRGVSPAGVRHGDMRIGGWSLDGRGESFDGIEVYQTNNDDGEDRFNAYRLGDYVHWNAWDVHTGKRLEGRINRIDVIYGPHCIVQAARAMVKVEGRLLVEVAVDRLRNAKVPTPYIDNVLRKCSDALIKTWSEALIKTPTVETAPAPTPPAPSPAAAAVFDPYDDLRAWAKAHAPLGYVQAQRVLDLLKDYNAVQASLKQAADVAIERCIVGRPTEKTPTFVVTEAVQLGSRARQGAICAVTTGAYDLDQLKSLVEKRVTITLAAKEKGQETD